MNAARTGAAVLAVGLMGLALAAMAVNELRVAGVAFLAMSFTIYLREERL